MDERDALLAGLRDPVPPEVGWWPLAPGWWFVVALTVFVVLCSVLAWRRHARSRDALAWRRAARAELVALRARLGDVPAGTIVADASVLARRSLLAIRPRAAIASLNGEAWLRELDAASGGDRFTRGAGRLLDRGPYERVSGATRDELAALLDALDELLSIAGGRVSGGRTDGPSGRPRGAIRESRS